jgi:hypothetical protein
MNVTAQFSGSARLQRAGDDILSSRTLLRACTDRKFARNESLFQHDDETSMRAGCASRKMS